MSISIGRAEGRPVVKADWPNRMAGHALQNRPPRGQPQTGQVEG